MAAVGRIPAGVGRLLDRLANGPPPIRWFVRAFSSVWLGILWLVLVGAYIAVGSGFASLCAHLEMTDLQFFDAWPMVTLLALLAVNLSIVTLRRIPLTLYKVGVWLVHIGILTLITGCVLYFSQKREGSMRIFLNQSVGAYYDTTERALYLTRMDPANPAQAAGPEIMVPLKDLPIYYERLARNPANGLPGKPLDLAIPAAALAPDPQLAGLTVRITGFYPYADLDEAWTAGPAGAPPDNPAILVGLRSGSAEGGQWLVAKRPATRVMEAPDIPFAVEYLYHPTAEQLADVTASFMGDEAITVRIPKLKIDRTYVVAPDQPIAVEGSPYTLTPRQIMAMPLRSAGYEGLSTTMLLTEIVRKDARGDFRFDRDVLFRFPERSPDFITTADGQQKRIQDRVDNDIQLSFHDASRDQFWIVEDDKGQLALPPRPRRKGRCAAGDGRRRDKRDRGGRHSAAAERAGVHAGRGDGARRPMGSARRAGPPDDGDGSHHAQCD